MFTEAQNLAITRTELDDVFYQEMEYDRSEPGIATARTAELFKPLDTDSSAYIFEIYKGSPLYANVNEVQSVPLSTPQAANKTFAYVKDYALGINISKDLFDDKLLVSFKNIVVIKLGELLENSCKWAISSQAI